MSDGNTTDLTEDGEPAPAAKGKKASKTPKAPKEPKVEKEPKLKKDKKSKDPKDEIGKGGGAGGIILIMLLVLIILISGFAAALYFDVFNAREVIGDVITDPLLDIIIWLDPGFSTINARLEAERLTLERRYQERNEDLNERESHIILMEGVLDNRENMLDRRENDLDRREEQIIAMYERTVPLHRRDPMSEQDLEDMMSLSRTYTQMSPDDAAERLVRLYDPRDVASILYYMSERNAASILAAMDPGYAANITEILLYT
jgi:flagellar motility protein MotE (MotC chaperone)